MTATIVAMSEELANSLGLAVVILVINAIGIAATVAVNSRNRRTPDGPKIRWVKTVGTQERGAA